MQRLETNCSSERGKLQEKNPCEIPDKKYPLPLLKWWENQLSICLKRGPDQCLFQSSLYRMH